MNYRKTLSNLGELGTKSLHEGYRSDATEYSFRKHVLLLLRELIDTNKENTKSIKKTMRANSVVLRELKNVLRRLAPDYLKNGSDNEKSK